MKLPDNPIYGYQALAQALGTTVGALHSANHRGTLKIKPVCSIGRTAVFDGDQVLAYIALRKKAKDA